MSIRLCLLRKFEENLLEFGLDTWGNLSSMVEIIPGLEGDRGAGAGEEPGEPRHVSYVLAL